MFRALLFFTCLSLSGLSFADTPTIAAFTKDMVAKRGFVPLYYQQDAGKVFIELANLEQPMLFQSSLPQGVGSNDIGLDRGQLGETRLVRFEHFGDKVLLKQLNTFYRASSANQAEQTSIDEAFADSVIAGLPIVAKDQGKLLVDYTDFLLSDIHGIAERLNKTKQGKYKADPKRSGVYLPKTKAFVDNTELEALVTFAGSNPGNFVKQVAPAPKSISVHLHHSFVRLPDDGYQMRDFHPYSGFWKVSHMDYSVPISDSMEQRYIPRHRLAKKDPNARVSEAVEPIVYYLDPGIPEPVMTALREGALWWDQAFEAIGYKDAFQVKVLPEDADPMDVRYNVIQWVHRATRGWSYGSSVIDPRTGEIIKGHVTLGSLRVRQDYLIALGLTSPFDVAKADTSQQQQMALNRIRQLSAHEVGHTLGIAHNFAASGDDRASVMDYPHPKLAIKAGQIELDDAYDLGIGVWDKHVIAYGYQDLPNKANEAQYLATVVKKGKEQGLDYQSDPDARPKGAANPVGHLWDNGKDPIAEFEHISQVRKLALEQFGLNSLPTGESLSSLQERLVPIYLLHRYQLDAVAKLIAGRHYSYELKEQGSQAKGIEAVSSEKQRQALEALLTTISSDYLTLPEHIVGLITPKAYGEALNRESFKGRTGLVFDPVSAAESAAAYTLTLILEPSRLNRLAQQQGKQFTLDKMLTLLIEQRIKRDLKDSLVTKRIAYLTLDALVKVSMDKKLAPEVMAHVTYHLDELTQWLANRKGADYRVMQRWLTWYWQTGQWKGLIEVKSLPPGSPI